MVACVPPTGLSPESHGGRTYMHLVHTVCLPHSRRAVSMEQVNIEIKEINSNTHRSADPSTVRVPLIIS